MTTEPQYVAVPRGDTVGAYKWFETEEKARAGASAMSKRPKTPHCKITRVSAGGAEHVARYRRGKEQHA